MATSQSRQTNNIIQICHQLYQDRLITKSTGRLLPAQPDPSTIQRVLDIMCGPGGWSIDIASAYPHIHVVGMDHNHEAVTSASLLSQAENRHNITFQEADLLQEWDFSDNSFDLVSARLLSTRMQPYDWLHVLQEAQRVLRPSGMLNLIELETAMTSSPTCQQVYSTLTRARQLYNHAPPDRKEAISVAPMLTQLLHDRGYQHVMVKLHPVDYSYGSDFYKEWLEALIALHYFITPFIVGMRAATQENWNAWCQRALVDMRSTHFRGVLLLFTVWGTAPLQKDI